MKWRLLITALLLVASVWPLVLPSPATSRLLASTPPTVTTIMADNITTNSAILVGNIDSMGTATTTNVSFQWGKSSGNYTYETTPEARTARVSFFSTISGLNPGTIYHFRAKADGGIHGTSYGAEKSFITKLLLGDANGDGKVDALDITKVERIIGRFDTPIPGADANADGNINAVDITRVERITAGLDRTLQIEWERIFDEQGNCVQQTSDGGFIIVGSTYFADDRQEDLWLMKTDRSGNELWERTFDGPGHDSGFYVQQTDGGGFIVLGKTQSPNYSSSYVWLIKTDSNGLKQWDQKLDTGYGGGFSAIEQTSDGGYVMVGYIRSGSGNNTWQIKTDKNGSILWDKKFGGDNKGYSIQITSDGGYIISGQMFPTSGGNPSAWLIKTDAGGNEQWERTYPSPGSASSAQSVLQTSTGNYVMVGDDEHGYVLLIQADDEGHELWRRTFGGLRGDHGSSIAPTNDGGYMIVGTHAGTLFLVKTDVNGDKIWEQLLSDPYSGYGSGGIFVTQTFDGGNIVLGFLGGATGRTTWLIKLK